MTPSRATKKKKKVISKKASKKKLSNKKKKATPRVLTAADSQRELQALRKQVALALQYYASERGTGELCREGKRLFNELVKACDVDVRTTIEDFSLTVNLHDFQAISEQYVRDNMEDFEVEVKYKGEPVGVYSVGCW